MSWGVEVDEDGTFVRFEGKGDVDYGFRVYLPDPERQPKEFDRAVHVLVDALNEAKVVVE